MALHPPSTTKTTIARHPQPIPLLFFGGIEETLDDGSKYNPSVISFIRDEWIYKQVQEREPEYTEYRALRAFVGTWNVNGKFPREDIAAWLCDGADADAEGKLALPDIYVIGLQEMVDLTVTNVVALGGQAGKRSEQWISMLDRTLNDAAYIGDKYELIGTRYLVGVMIAVFVKSRYARAVSDVQDAEAPVGVMGIMGNKGGVSIRMRVFDSTFCFVCAHLAAHRNAVAQRNADFASIMAKTEFRSDESTALATAGGATGGSGTGGGGGGGGAGGSGGPADTGKFSILDHDFVVWFGDFNYRIVETVSTERCFELACSGRDEDLEALRQRDQLNIERAAQRSFHGFTEGPLTFRPTYKFQPGTSLYEQRPEKKLRAPAWCDRILWRTAPELDPRFFRQLYYGSVDEMVTSDHKPVHSVFECAVKTIIWDKREAVVADITRQLDAMENRSMPKVTVSSMVIHVPDVVYAIPATRTITVENVGDVSATWRFVPKPEEKWFAKTWLSVEPAYGLIPPGGTATITLTITVDDAVARDISLGREVALPPLGAGAMVGSGGAASASTAATGGGGSTGSAPGGGAAGAAAGVTTAAVGGLLEDVLILRMERGRDYYLSVSASVLPTCFGCSLSQLARRPEPMRALAVTSTATAALHAAAGLALGVSPSVSAAALAGGAAGSSGAPAAAATTAAAAGGGVGATGTASVKPLPPAVDFAAGSHTLAARLAADEIDVHLPSVAAAALAAPSDPFSFSASAVSFPSPAGAASGSGGTGIFGAPSASSSSDASRKGSALMSVPKEVWRLVDVIFTRGLDTRGLFLAPGDAADLIIVRECLDTGEAFPASIDILAVAQALLDLLESLREPVIPCALFPGPDSRSIPADLIVSHILKALAPLHYNVLIYLTRFGREVLAHGTRNGCSVDDLAFVFSRCLMRRVPHDEAPAHAPLGDVAGGDASGSGGSGGAAAMGGSGAGGGRGGGGSGHGGADDEDAGAAIAKLSLYADKGTRWEPTREEQEAMSRVMAALLTTASLA